MRHFEMRGGGSSKFWEIACDESTLTVRFGKIGTDGQTQKKQLASPPAARKEHDRLVGEKLKKGYVELVSISAADPDWPPKTGVLADALRLFERMTTSTPARSVLVGKVTFPPGGMKKWLAKKVRWSDETVAELLARAEKLTASGDGFFELAVKGDVLEIRGWDWLQRERLEDALVNALEAGASLQPKGGMKRFSRYAHGSTQWVTWKHAGKKLDVDEGEGFDWDGDARVKRALAEITPHLQAWVAAHPDVPVRVERSGKWGHVDLGGREVIAPVHQSAYPFSEGRAFVTTGMGELRMIDEEGNWVGGSWQYHGGDFARGLAPVSVDELYGYVDRAGNMRIRPQFVSAQPFTGPLAVVDREHAGLRWITQEGELVGDPFDHAHGFFEERAWVWPGARKAWGCVDESGRLVIACAYYDCRPFSEGLAAVRASESAKWGYIDLAGKMVLPPKFDEAHAFSEGRAIVKLGKVHRLVDRKGTFVGKPFDEILPTRITPQGFYTSAVRDGVLGFKTGGKVGYMSRDGEVLVEPRFVHGGELCEGLAIVGVKKKSGVRYGHIDRSGAWVIPATFEELHPFSEGRARVKIGERYGFLDRSGAMAVPPRYKQVQAAFRDGRAWVQMP